MSLKNPATPPGIDPGTFRLVAQCLNHYATPGPRLVSITWQKWLGWRQKSVGTWHAWRRSECINGFGGECWQLEERHEYEDAGTAQRITVNWISKKQDGTAWNEYARLMTTNCGGICLFFGESDLLCTFIALSIFSLLHKFYIFTSFLLFSLTSFPPIIIRFPLPPSSLNASCVSTYCSK